MEIKQPGLKKQREIQEIPLVKQEKEKYPKFESNSIAPIFPIAKQMDKKQQNLKKQSGTKCNFIVKQRRAILSNMERDSTSQAVPNTIQIKKKQPNLRKQSQAQQSPIVRQRRASHSNMNSNSIEQIVPIVNRIIPGDREKASSSLFYKKIRYTMATSLLVAGVVVIFFGLLYEPQGEIHHSILTLFGELATFACFLLGIEPENKRGKKLSKQESY